ncbi:MAG: hypothetical protein KDI44_14115 [Thiothrix sp.]|nr:hypothetical protein [Thiothrix sp.]HPQ94723.1 hypothetical protein [Thiolinea sp.]
MTATAQNNPELLRQITHDNNNHITHTLQHYIEISDFLREMLSDNRDYMRLKSMVSKVWNRQSGKSRLEVMRTHR